MSKVKAKVLRGIIGGVKVGEEVSLENRQADRLEANGYIERVEVKKSAPAKKKEEGDA